MSAGVAYLSTAYKPGVAEFADVLLRHDWQVYASNGTRREILGAGVSDVKTPADLIGPGELWGVPASQFDRELQANIIADAIRIGRVGLVYVGLKAVESVRDKSPFDIDGARRSLDQGGISMLAAGAMARRVTLSQETQLAEASARLENGSLYEQSYLDDLARVALAEITNYTETELKEFTTPDVRESLKKIPSPVPMVYIQP